MKKDYKVGDRVRVISCKHSHKFEMGYIGVITEFADIDYCIDNTWWVTAKEIKPATIGLNAKEPFFVKGDVKVWVWDSNSKDAKERYLYFIDNRGEWPVTVWDDGKTAKECNFCIYSTCYYKNASYTNPNEPEEKTIIIDGEKIKVSAESFNNLRDFFKGLDSE